MTDRDSAVLTVDEVAVALRIGRRQAYSAIQRGEIPSLRIGRTIRVPRAWLNQIQMLTGEPKDGGD